MSYWRNWWDLISISLVLSYSLRSLSCFWIKPVQGITGDKVIHWDSLGIHLDCMGSSMKVNKNGQIPLILQERAVKENTFFGLVTYFQRWLALVMVTFFFI